MFSFKKNAWVDTRVAVAVEWVTKTLKPVTEHMKRFVLLADNLTGQVHDEFKEAVSDISGVVWYGLSNGTDLWQPVDAGYAKMLKTLMAQEHHKWIDDDEHADRWYGNTEPYSAKERRIPITHWAGEAYKHLCSNEYELFRRRIWVKTCCLITADGSNDKQIVPEGLKDYQVPPTCQSLEPTICPQLVTVLRLMGHHHLSKM